MKAIRIGNDLSIAWTVNRCGAPENFFGKALKLFLTNRYGKIPVDSFSLKKNVIEFVFAGREQRDLGEYGLLLIENDNAADMYTVDISRAFALTLSNDPLCRCTSEVHLTSDIALPVNGLSAYEIAVQYGFSGTVEEWLESLKFVPEIASEEEIKVLFADLTLPDVDVSIIATEKEIVKLFN